MAKPGAHCTQNHPTPWEFLKKIGNSIRTPQTETAQPPPPPVELINVYGGEKQRCLLFTPSDNSKAYITFDCEIFVPVTAKVTKCVRSEFTHPLPYINQPPLSPFPVKSALRCIFSCSIYICTIILSSSTRSGGGG